MRRSIVVCVVALAACGGPSSSTTSPLATTGGASAANATPIVPTAGPTQAASPTALVFERNPAAVVEGVPYKVTIDPASFVNGIDHPFLPFVVGATFVFDGDEHVEVEVLPDTKVILGVTVTVVRDRVYEDDELVEDTLDWYAQDREGNVWYFGEETAEYENGKVVSTAGAWEAGVDGALPGIIMLAEPRPGDQYRQEFYEGEAEDMASITATSGSVSVEAGAWAGADVRVTEEWTPLEAGVRERKTYARGFGVVEIRTIEGGDELTTLTSATFPG